MSKPTNFDLKESLDVVWDALHGYRENCIPEGDPRYDEEWGDICTAMAWVTEALQDAGEIDVDTPEELT